MLNYEIIKILEIIIKFGLFSAKQSKSSNNNEHQSIKDCDKSMRDSDMEKLINYLSFFLEYDEKYFKEMNSHDNRKYVEQRKITADLDEKK